MEAPKKKKSSKYLVFLLGDVRFAAPLGDVKEVIGKLSMTPMPQAPADFKGLINVRGRIIHVIDLRERLQLAPSSSENRRSCIIISEFNDMVVGSIVDQVLEVRTIAESQIESQVDIKSTVSREYIVGIARFEDYPITIVLDIHKALDMQDLSLIRNHGAA